MMSTPATTCVIAQATVPEPGTSDSRQSTEGTICASRITTATTKIRPCQAG